MEQYREISLANLIGGAVEERFQRALNRVVDNVLDINTDPKKKRKIRIDIGFKPAETRTAATIEVGIETTLAADKVVDSTVHFQLTGGDAKVLEFDPNQPLLPGLNEEESEGIAEDETKN